MYKLIIVTGGNGKLQGYTLEFDKYRDANAILEAAQTTADDFDTEEDYEYYLETAPFIIGEVDVIDADGNEFTECAPTLEGYTGYALFDGNELEETDTYDSETRYFLEKYYGVAEEIED